MSENATLMNKAAELKAISQFITVTLVGKWLWIEGGTKAVKDQLKAAGCIYASKKKAWCWYEGISPRRYYRRKTPTLPKVKEKYGEEEV